MINENYRYRLSLSGALIAHRQTESQALSAAYYMASAEGARVHVYDSQAPVGQVELWELRPWEEFGRVLSVAN